MHCWYQCSLHSISLYECVSKLIYQCSQHHTAPSLRWWKGSATTLLLVIGRSTSSTININIHHPYHWPQTIIEIFIYDHFELETQVFCQIYKVSRFSWKCKQNYLPGNEWSRGINDTWRGELFTKYAFLIFIERYYISAKRRTLLRLNPPRLDQGGGGL